MITDKRISEAAKAYAKSMKSDLKTQAMVRTDFGAGVRFAEAEITTKTETLSDDIIVEYHLKKINAFKNFMRDKGNLAAIVFLRATGALNNHDGTYTIQESDIKAWFESGSHLSSFTEIDIM